MSNLAITSWFGCVCEGVFGYTGVFTQTFISLGKLKGSEYSETECCFSVFSFDSGDSKHTCPL